MPPFCFPNHVLSCLLFAVRSSKPFLCPALNSCSICIHTAQWLCPQVHDPSGLTPDLSPHAQHMCRGLIRAFFSNLNPSIVAFCCSPLRLAASIFLISVLISLISSFSSPSSPSSVCGTFFRLWSFSLIAVVLLRLRGALSGTGSSFA